jgi:hypothetical protein
MEMRFRATIGLMALAASWLVMAGGGPASAQATTTCTWGGTPAAPTGSFTVSPGITNTPAPEPLKFEATGPLAGGGRCTGKMTLAGQVNAGSTCLQASFQGTVRGVPGVDRFWGEGNALVHEFLYDKDGNLVGADQPSVGPPPADDPLYINCNSPQGETDIAFSAIVELFD